MTRACVCLQDLIKVIENGISRLPDHELECQEL